MATISLVFRLVSAMGWSLIILCGLALEGFQPGVFPMVGWIVLSLVPHRLLLRSSIVFAVVMAVSLLPLFGLVYMVLTMRPVNAEPAGYKIWLATGLAVAALLLALLPVSLLLSYFGARPGRSSEIDHAVQKG